MSNPTFTFPPATTRQILENAIIGVEDGTEDSKEPVIARAGIVAGAVGASFALAQIGGFGVVANLVGGVAQGTLAFIMPPAIAIALLDEENDEGMGKDKIAQYAVGLFGGATVSAVTYFTITAST